MITFQRELISDKLLDEVTISSVAYDLEVQDEIAKEFPLNINRAAYARMEKMGVLRVFTVRAEGVLAGYACFVLCPSIRRDKLVIAMEDALYLMPEYRKAGNAIKLLKYIAGELVKECQVVTYHSPTVNPRFGKILAHQGYTKHSEYYTRRLTWPVLQ